MVAGLVAGEELPPPEESEPNPPPGLPLCSGLLLLCSGRFFDRLAAAEMSRCCQ